MAYFTFLFIFAAIWIFTATIFDLKKSEIPDWLNFSLVFFALGFRFFYSLFSMSNFSFFYQGVLGFLVFFILGNILYYSRMFAGGDAKLFYSLGAILPTFGNFSQNIGSFVVYIFFFVLVGAVYGIVGSAYLSIVNSERFKKGFVTLFRKNKRMVFVYDFIAIVILFLSFLVEPLIYIAILSFIFPYFYFFVKAVDEYCMVKSVSPSKITPGDWLYKDIKVGRKTIHATWNGLEKDEIELLKKRKKKVLLRYGIQYSPVFLISFILFWAFLNSYFFQILMRAFGF